MELSELSFDVGVQFCINLLLYNFHITPILIINFKES